MDHFKPHRNTKFEGFYSRFHLPSGASLLLIICKVHTATDGRPVNLTVVYVPADNTPIWKTELWPRDLEFSSEEQGEQDVAVDHPLRNAFNMRAPLDNVSNAGHSNAHDEQVNSNHLRIHHSKSGSSFDLRLDTSKSGGLVFQTKGFSHLAWSPDSRGFARDSPEGWLINLPLPLHWHVLSQYSPCIVNLRLPEEATKHMTDQDKELRCIAHHEKNWAHSFPRAHVWVQGVRMGGLPASAPALMLCHNDMKDVWSDASASRDTMHLLTVAGGLILGLEAYLVGYRNYRHGISLDFRPPFTVSLAPLFAFITIVLSYLPERLQAWLPSMSWLVSPFLRVQRDWPNRTLRFSFSNLFSRLDIEASAPRDRFYDFSAPMEEGFRDRWMAQSLNGTVTMQVWKRMFPGFRWQLVCKDYFENAGVEFGGEFYPGRGKGENNTRNWGPS